MWYKVTLRISPPGNVRGPYTEHDVIVESATLGDVVPDIINSCDVQQLVSGQFSRIVAIHIDPFFGIVVF